MRRMYLIPAALIGILAGAPAVATAATLVLPLRTQGVDGSTAAVSRDVLAHELRVRGVDALGIRLMHENLPEGIEGCDELDCALALAREHGATKVVYGSMSRLGEKILVRVSAVDLASGVPAYNDRFSAYSVEDLDTVMLRAAEGVALGRANSDQATVDSVILDETFEPQRRATRRGLGIRGGFIFPVGDSYGGADRLTSLNLVYKYEARGFIVETTTIAGIAWGDGAFEWTPLDVFVAKVFGVEDTSPYLGAGLGIRTVKVEKRVDANNTGPYGPSYYTTDVTETSLSFDVGVGVMALRTFDLNLIAELRYHYVFEQFDEAGGNGAHGLWLTFGTGR